MGTNVYANGDEICCKSADGRTSVAFPDPCWTPPTPPAGPLLITYPNSAGPSSLKKGSSTVCIKRSAIALTDRSYFSTSTGDEPATPALQKGLLTRKIKGKAYFKQWSMNVKVEGKGVCRNIDLMTHNHGSVPGNTATFPFLDGAARGSSDGDPCGKEKKKVTENCAPDKASKAAGKDWTDKNCDDPLLRIKPGTEKTHDKNNDPLSASVVLSSALKSVGLPENKYSSVTDFANAQSLQAKKSPCLQAKKCELVPYNESAKSGEKGNAKGCCNGQTGHHVIPDAVASKAGCKNYNKNTAPCICVEGFSYHKGTHEDMHEKFADINLRQFRKKSGDLFSMAEIINMGVESVVAAFPESGCSKSCIQKQLKAYYQECDPNSKMGPVGKDSKLLDTNKIAPPRSIPSGRPRSANAGV